MAPWYRWRSKKLSTLDIAYICPLHGLIWRENFAYFLDKYDKWSRYEEESKGVVIIYGSLYGHTANAAAILASKLSENGVKDVRVYDASKTHVSELISEIFRVKTSFSLRPPIMRKSILP